MGVDIYGWVECNSGYTFREKETPWVAAIPLYLLYHGRDYDAFGCLFGVKNYANFRPIAEERGLPPDVSEQVKEDAERFDGAYGHSWITWAEIKAIDWEEETETADNRVHEYKRDEKGNLVFQSKAAMSRSFVEDAGVSYKTLEAMGWPAGLEWEVNGRVYRTEKIKRKETRAGWTDLFAVMEVLARNYGDDGVRLVVWFAF